MNDKFIVYRAVILYGLVAVSSGKDVPVGVGPLNILAKCSSESGANGIINCAAEKMLRSLEKVSGQPNLELLPGVSISSDGTEKSRIAKELSSDLPVNPSERMTKLMELIMNAMSRMISGKTLKIKLPATETLARTLEEGRGKNKRMSNPFFMMGGLFLTIIIPVVLGGLGLLTSKALIVAKLALVVSLISFVQYFMRNGSFLPGGYYGSFGYGTQSTYGTPVYGAPAFGGGTNNLGPGLGGPYKRSFQDDSTGDAQDVAYSAHK